MLTSSKNLLTLGGVSAGLVVAAGLLFAKIKMLESPEHPTLIVGTSIMPLPQPPSEVAFLEHFETQRVVTEPLLLRDRHDTPRPRIAESARHSGNEILITIRKDAKFSDGTPILAKDVIWSFKALLRSRIGAESLIARCLGRHGADGIRERSKLSLAIESRGCDPSRLIEEFASPNYAVLKEGTFYGRKPADLWSEPVSGMYIMKQAGSAVRFLPNPHHFLYQKDNPPPVLQFEAIDSRILSTFNRSPAVDLFKSLSPQVVGAAATRGYAVMTSPPIMSWYLSSDRSKTLEERKDTDELLLALKSGPGFALPYFSNNPLETQASAFFPSDFGCDKPIIKSAQSQRISIQTDRPVTVVGHISGESNAFSEQVVAELRARGIKARLSPRSSETNPNALSSESQGLQIFIYRQFLGPDFLTTFQLLFHTFRTISDPTKAMGQLLTEFEAVPRANQTQVLKKMCDTLAGYPFIPLAHRKIAYVAKDQRYFRVVSQASGYFSFASILGWDD